MKPYYNFPFIAIKYLPFGYKKYKRTKESFSPFSFFFFRVFGNAGMIDESMNTLCERYSSY